MKLRTVLFLFHQVQFPLGKPTSSHYKSVDNYERREMMLHTPQLASGDLAGALWSRVPEIWLQPVPCGETGQRLRLVLQMRR